tara:strand:+ start:7800 stop:8441 length:642 start_codon:yes stop_codon:yes gene_type:complete
MPRIKPRPTRATRAKQGGAPKPSIEDRLLAAMERLLEQGQRFAVVSVEQLCQEAGISRATFYLHFRDKGQLVARLMAHVTEEIIDSTGTWMSNAENAERKDVQQALVGMVQTFKKHQATLSAVIDTAPHDESVAALYQQMVDRICEQSRDSLDVIQRKGLSRPGATHDVANDLGAMLVMYCIRVVGDLDEEGLARLAGSLGYISASTAFSDSN